MIVEQLTKEQVALVRSAVYSGFASVEDGYRPGDELADTLHFGVVVDGEPVSVGTINHDASPRNAHTPVWRIRGMATLEEHQGRGYGGAILRHLIDHIAANGGGLFWGDLRVAAVAFYERHGFEVDDDVYPTRSGLPHRYGSLLVDAL
jgi:GNAT superfamily N-acetyltransferase